MPTPAVPALPSGDTLERIHQLFDLRRAQSPRQVFMHTLQGPITFAALGAMVDALEAELHAQGVQAGDRVLIVAENCPEHVALILACSRVGAWSCGVNARMSRGEVEVFARKADPRLVYFTSAVSDAAAQHGQHFGAQPSALAGLAHSPRRPEATPESAPLAQEVAAIIFTSGTTGAPKGVLVSHAGLLQFARVSTESRDLGPQDRSYAYVPMTHIFGLGTVLMASLHAGAQLVMRSRFDPVDVFQALAHEGISNLQGPPAMFTRLLHWLDEQGIDQPEAPVLRYVYTGAAALDPALMRAVQARFGLPLHHGYGLSEYAGAVALVPRNSHRQDTSAGYAVEGAELRIVHPETRAELPQGERGEIWMRGVGRMPGYFRDPEATAQAIQEDGWYASGDLGYLAPDGAIFVVGRLKEMIIRSGFNVYPGEVEAVLLQYPGIRHAAVAGRKQSDGNEEVLAFVEPADPAQPLDFLALQAFLAEHLAPYKRPSRIVPVEAMPMTHSGKILKRSLVESLQD